MECGSSLPLSIHPEHPCRLPPAANRRRSPGAPPTETPPQKAAASYRSPKRLRRGGGLTWSPPTPQASMECGSSLPLSIHPEHPCRLPPAANRRRSPGAPPIETPPQKAAASYRSPKRLCRDSCISDAAGVHGVRKLASAFDPPGTPMPSPTGGQPPPKPGRTSDRDPSTESGSKLPQSKAAAPRWRDCDAAGVYGVRKLASAFDPPGTSMPSPTGGQPPPKPGRTSDRDPSTESGSKLPQSKAASPRCRSSSIRTSVGSSHRDLVPAGAGCPELLETTPLSASGRRSLQNPSHAAAATLAGDLLSGLLGIARGLMGGTLERSMTLWGVAESPFLDANPNAE